MIILPEIWVEYGFAWINSSGSFVWAWHKNGFSQALNARNMLEDTWGDKHGFSSIHSRPYIREGNVALPGLMLYQGS